MGAAEVYAAVVQQQDSLQRELREQREMREQRSEQNEQQMFSDEVKRRKAIVKTAAHLAELSKRTKAAGGWATSATLRDRDDHMQFGEQDDEPESDSGLLRTDSSFRSGPTPVEPEPPAPKVAPRRTARASSDGDDEDDYSSQTWMR